MVKSGNKKARFFKNELFCGCFLRFSVNFNAFVVAGGYKADIKKRREAAFFAFISAGAELLPEQLSAAG